MTFYILVGDSVKMYEAVARAHAIKAKLFTSGMVHERLLLTKCASATGAVLSFESC